jgi:DNA-binding transcriptional LysR family regulator
MRNATLRQMRMLAAVVRTGSVTEAATALNVTPPAVTMQLRLLQDLAGLPLVERGPAGMVATEAGRVVAEAAARMEALLAECGAAVAALSGGDQGVVAVGVVSTAKYFAPRALAGFLRLHPGIDLRLSIGNRADVIEGLRALALDIAIMGRPPDDLPVDADFFGDHPHVVVARPDHRLAGRRAIDAATIARETFLVREPGSGTRGLMERFFGAAGVMPRIGMQIGSNETIKQAVIAGLGITFISAHTVEAELSGRRLVVLDVEGLPAVRQWFVVSARQRALLPAARKLRSFLLEEGRLYLPGRTAGSSSPGAENLRQDFTELHSRRASRG